MRGKAKRILSVFLALVMILTGIPGRQASVKKAAAAGVNYEKGSDMGNLLGLMQEFGIFAFTELRDASHVHSNMVTGNLLANPDNQQQYASGDFTIKEGKGRTAGSSFVNYIGTFSELTSQYKDMKVGYKNDRLVVGSANTVIEYEPGRFKVNGCAVLDSTIVDYETDSEKFINLANLKRSFGFYSGQLAAMPEAGATVDFTDMNKRTITTELNSGVAVINMKASAMDGSNDQINVHTSGAVLVINVDMEGASSYTFPAAIGTVINGTAVARGEDNFLHPENNRVIWNFIDSTKSDGRFTGEVTIKNFTAGTILAPYAKVISHETGIEGVLVADRAEIRGEFHRINPYNGFPQPQPISNASFGLIKEYSDDDLKTMTDEARKELLDNTKFTLYKEDGKTVVAGPKVLSWNATEQRAEVTFTDVNCGTSADVYKYVLKETQAPSGYTKNDVVVDCQVLRDAQTGLLTVFYKRSTDTDDKYDKAFPTFKNTKKAAINPEVVFADSWVFGETVADPTIKDGGNPGEATVTYTYYKKNADDSYTELAGKPTDVGTYKVVATIPETDNYQSGTASKEFHIDKADNTLQVNDSQVSVQRTEPYHTANTIDLKESVSKGDGAGTVTYAIEGEAYGCSVDPNTGVFTSGSDAPKTVTVKVSATGDGNHNPKTDFIEVSVTQKKVNNPAVSMGSWTYGETAPTPVVTGNETANDPEFEYYDTVNNKSLGTNRPELPGKYEVRITVKGDMNYEPAAASADFTVSKATPAVTIDAINERTYDGKATETPKYTVTGVNSDTIEVASIQYKKDTPDGTYTSTAPTEAGNYIVCVTTKESEKYKSASETAKFTISKAEDPCVVTKTAEVMRDHTIDLSTLVSGAEGTVSYTIASDDTGASLSGSALTAGNKTGTITVNVTIADSVNHKGRTEQITVTVGNKKTISNPAVDITGWTYDETADKPSVPTASNPGNATDITYRYKRADEGDEKYTMTVPTDAGTYIVQAVIPETEDYCGATATKQFTIDKAANAMSTDAVTGNPVMRGGETSLAEHANGANGTPSYSLATPVDGVSISSDGKLTLNSSVQKDTEITVTITAPGDANHEAASKTVTVKVLDKNPSTVSVTVSAEKEYDGTAAEPTVSGVPGGVTPVIKYQKKNDSGAYEDLAPGELPKDVGTYKVIVTVAETANQCGATVEKDFVIKPAKLTVTADDKEIVYESGEPVLTYKVSGQKNGENPSLNIKIDIYPETLEVGNHSLTPTGEKLQGNYELTFVAGKLTVKKAEISTNDVTLTQEDITYGETLPSPVIKGLPSEIDPSSLIIEYKPKEGGNYDTKLPAEAGEYTVRVTVPETLHYLEKTLEADFKIELAEDPAVIDTADKSVYSNPDAEAPTHSVDLKSLVSGAAGNVSFSIDTTLSDVKDAKIKLDDTLVPGKETGTVYIIVTVGGSDNYYGKTTTIKVTVKEEPKKDPKEDPKTDPKEDPKEDTKEDPKTDSKEDPKEDPKTDPKADPKEDTKEDPKTDPKEDPKTDPKTDPKEDTKEDPETDPKEDSKTDPAVDPGLSSTTDPKADPAVDPKIDPKEDPKTDPTDDPAKSSAEEPEAEAKSAPAEDPSGLGGDTPAEDPSGLGGDAPEEPTAPIAKTVYKADTTVKKAYTKGTKKPVPVAIHGSFGTEKMLSSFSGISYGGTALVKGEDFTLDEAGVVTFLPKFLETLPAGECSISIAFADGDTVVFPIFVTIPPATDMSPSTGDFGTELIWLLMLLSGAALIVLLVSRRRARR